MSSEWTKTTCPYCGVGCGVLARPSADGRVADVKGDPQHPANFGRLCSKGTALGDTLGPEGRLLSPQIDGRAASWDAALDLVAGKFRDAVDEHGPDSVALYVSGQLLTEDYYVANKLMKGYIGSANIDTNSRLCMASSVAGHKRAFGADVVPGCYEDLELADLVILVGSNLAWCHPVLFQRLVAAKEARGTEIIVIDPRRTATAAIADRHLAIAGGSDVALFNGLLHFLAERGAINRTYVNANTDGFDDALKAASALSLADISELTGLPRAVIGSFYEAFARTERVVTVFSQGVNQSTAGTDKVNAIINCHLATARIGKPGMGPFSVTGQPNAMGGREVGGLATMLAAHMELENATHRQLVQSFWKSPRIADKPGLKAVDLFRAVGDGRIKALWIMATNPAVSLPDADKVRDALRACPFVVVSDVERHTDTTALADVLLPSAAWGEKSGTVTNSERRISRQRAFLPSPGEARADWWQLAEIARRMGFAEGFAWSSPAEIFAEYAGLTAASNGGSRALELLPHAGLSVGQYDALQPFQWPQRESAAPTQRLFGDGAFFTPNGRARFVAAPFRPATTLPTEDEFVLNSGRIRDQWHTMTRTGRSARLSSHGAEPFVEIHPDDAARLSIAAGDLAKVSRDGRQILSRALITDRVAVGTVFAPMHWSDRFASKGRVGSLYSANVDPVSGQPELKHGAVRVERFDGQWFAFGAGIDEPRALAVDYWAIAKAEHGWRMELGALSAPCDDVSALAALWPDLKGLELLSYIDRAAGETRLALFDGPRLCAVLFTAPTPVVCDRNFILGQFGMAAGSGLTRLRVLAGRGGAAVADAGPVICACLGVGRTAIVNSIRAHGSACSVEAVGTATGAGTNCGSCRPEIRGMIDAARCTQAG